MEKIAKELLREDVVAFDTEADSFYHYFDKVCLVQIATRKKCWLVDPLGPDGASILERFGTGLRLPERFESSFHAAEYDIYVLKRDCGFEFTNLVRHDGLCTAPRVPGDRSRSVSRKTFRRRPSEGTTTIRLVPTAAFRQTTQTYAASDVLYLIKLAEKLEKELRKAKRLDWAVDDFETLSARRRWPDREFDKLGYLKIKGRSRSMDPVALAVLRELFLLRDKRAREIDRPPFKVLGNRTLLEISETHATDLDSLAEIKGITDLILKRLGKDLVAAVKKGLRKATRSDSEARNDRPGGAWIGASEKRLARTQGLAWTPFRSAQARSRRSLSPNAALESIAAANPKNAEDMKALPEFKSWFVREFSSEIIAVLERHAADDGSNDPDAAPRRTGTRRPKRSGKRRRAEPLR